MKIGVKNGCDKRSDKVSSQALKSKMSAVATAPRRRRPVVVDIAPTPTPVPFVEEPLPVPARRRGGGTFAPTVEGLQNRLNYANRRCKFAWAQYYQAIRGDNEEDHDTYDRYMRIINSDEPASTTTPTETMPSHIKNELKEMADRLKKKWECPVCFEFIETENLDITNCGHFYCKGCLNSWKENCKSQAKEKWDCCVCKRKHNYRDEE